MFSSEFKGLFGSVATSSKANNENAGFLTPRIKTKMPLASSSNAYNENGFVTPRNKNIIPGKTLFSDKPKVALGDRKNTAFNVMTPLKHCNVFIDVSKPEAVFQPMAPKLQISNIPNDPCSTPTKGNFCASEKSNLEMWNENLMLSDDQFNLLFMEPNVDIAPPIPSPEPKWTNSYVESPPPVPWHNFSLESPAESGNVSEDYELPSMNNSFDELY